MSWGAHGAMGELKSPLGVMAWVSPSIHSYFGSPCCSVVHVHARVVVSLHRLLALLPALVYTMQMTTHDISDTSVAQPTTRPIEQVLQELRELGHWPRRRKNPTPGAEEAENKLGRKLCHHNLQEGDQRVLDALRTSDHSESGGAHPADMSHDTSLDDDLLRQVLELGRMPRRMKIPETEAQQAEKTLQKNLCYRGLVERAQRELNRVGSNRDDDLLREVLQLGRMPREFKDTRTDADRAESNLRQKLRRPWSPSAT